MGVGTGSMSALILGVYGEKVGSGLDSNLP
jgi:hypothetical protein